MKKIICTVCPNGCRLTVDEKADYAVSGARCPRGIEYGKNEATCPRRVLTTTVKIEGAAYPRLPVKSAVAIPRERIFEVMALLDGITVSSPVKTGDVILSDILEGETSIIACKDM